MGRRCGRSTGPAAAGASLLKIVWRGGGHPNGNLLVTRCLWQVALARRQKIFHQGPSIRVTRCAPSTPPTGRGDRCYSGISMFYGAYLVDDRVDLSAMWRERNGWHRSGRGP